MSSWIMKNIYYYPKSSEWQEPYFIFTTVNAILTLSFLWTFSWTFQSPTYFCQQSSSHIHSLYRVAKYFLLWKEVANTYSQIQYSNFSRTWYTVHNSSFSRDQKAPLFRSQIKYVFPFPLTDNFTIFLHIALVRLNWYHSCGVLLLSLQLMDLW